MNLTIAPNQFKDFNIYFCESVKNNIMLDGNFIRILYSSNKITLNCIYISFNLNDITCGKYFNKYKLNFNKLTTKNEENIKMLKLIEFYILNKFGLKTQKLPQYKIAEQLDQYYIKLYNQYNNDNIQLMLKISGIWENQKHYGLTYKFYPSVV
jgi:hypothetical protein